ncbi:hypothetical protein V6N11_079801 [Hibiscus sabdariffa]|uniref:MADS-box domain-containing protein n=1 Tax=Hibiscus sabdariffa TaxID=183260 RepID=A0ABR2RWG9_9ROSI
MASSGKKTGGRQKIEMKAIEKEDDKLITFSKRKPFSFGHPSIESVANRFFNNNIFPPDSNSHSLVETQQKERIDQIIQHYNEATRQMDAAKEIEKTLASQESGRETIFWWEAPIDKLNLQELEELESCYAKHVNELYNARNKKIAGTTNTNDHVVASFFPGAR